MTWVNYLVNSYSNDLGKLLGKVNDGITVIQIFMPEVLSLTHIIANYN